MNIAFIGLGKMGTAIALRFLEANYQLTIYNRTKEKALPLVEKGAVLADSLDSCVVDADIIFLCLFDDKSVRKATLGILPKVKPSALCVDIATTSTALAKELTKKCAEYQVEFISAKVFGVPEAVSAQQVTAFVGGSIVALNRVQPLLKSYCRKIIHTGSEAATANAMKLACNYHILNTIKMCSEMYCFAEKQNISDAVMHDFLAEVYGNHASFKLYVDKINRRDFDQVNFNVESGLKDEDLTLSAFLEKNIYPDMLAEVHKMIHTAISLGLSEKDWSAISEVQRHTCGLDNMLGVVDA